MTNDNGQKNVESLAKFESRAEGIEKRAEQKERNEASANFESLSDAVKAHRKKQHESGESGITGKGDKDGTFASAKDILGNFARKDTNKTDAGSESHKTLFQSALSICVTERSKSNSDFSKG